MTGKTMVNSFENCNFNDILNGKIPIDILIVAIGYEDRSAHILNMVHDKSDFIVTVKFSDFQTKHERCPTTILCDGKSTYENINASYGDWSPIKNRISSIIGQVRKNKDRPINIHIDYSSMPRHWYCNLFIELCLSNENQNNTYFWYTHGVYEKELKNFPSAGINEIKLFSGKPSLSSTRPRTHVIGCGFDNVRTKGILTVLDPSSYVACYSYPQNDYENKRHVMAKNDEIIDLAEYSFWLPLDNFKILLLKILEVTNDLLNRGDVILVPDGPKPMILACSIIPALVPNLVGVTCLHASRHSSLFSPVNVIATDTISGFNYRKLG